MLPVKCVHISTSVEKAPGKQVSDMPGRRGVIRSLGVSLRRLSFLRQDGVDYPLIDRP